MSVYCDHQLLITRLHIRITRKNMESKSHFDLAVGFLGTVLYKLGSFDFVTTFTFSGEFVA